MVYKIPPSSIELSLFYPARALRAESSIELSLFYPIRALRIESSLYLDYIILYRKYQDLKIGVLDYENHRLYGIIY